MKIINEADFREIIKKDGVEGWNRWWKRNEKAKFLSARIPEGLLRRLFTD